MFCHNPPPPRLGTGPLQGLFANLFFRTSSGRVRRCAKEQFKSKGKWRLRPQFFFACGASQPKSATLTVTIMHAWFGALVDVQGQERRPECENHADVLHGMCCPYVDPGGAFVRYAARRSVRSSSQSSLDLGLLPMCAALGSHRIQHFRKSRVQVVREAENLVSRVGHGGPKIIFAPDLYPD